MKSMFAGILIVASVWLAQQPPDGALTNATVIQLVKAGLSESVVLATVRAGNGRFDASPAAILDLKRNGVPDAVIAAIVEAASGVRPGRDSRAPLFQVALQRSTSDGTVWELLQAAPHREEMVTGLFSFGMKTRVPGQHATTETADPRPVFRITLAGAIAMRSVILSRFNESDEGGARELNRDSAEQVDVQPVDERTFRVVPRKNLKRGEYCWYNLSNDANAEVAVFDFRVIDARGR